LRLKNIVAHCLIICVLTYVGMAQQKQTTEAFDRYIAAAEKRVTPARGKGDSFLKIDALSADGSTPAR
jgi:hypothetical protein